MDDITDLPVHACTMGEMTGNGTMGRGNEERPLVEWERLDHFFYRHLFLGKEYFNGGDAVFLVMILEVLSLV